jgi:hypothetical protein
VIVSPPSSCQWHFSNVCHNLKKMNDMRWNCIRRHDDSDWSERQNEHCEVQAAVVRLGIINELNSMCEFASQPRMWSTDRDIIFSGHVLRRKDRRGWTVRITDPLCWCNGNGRSHLGFWAW